MESVLGRYRNITILVGVLFLQVLGLAVQVKRTGETDHSRLIRVWAVDAITPLERVLVWGQNGGNNLWRNYFFLRGVRAENRQLKEQIEQMRLQQVRLSEDASQARRLQSLLAFKEQFIGKTVPAQVIGSSGTDLSRFVYIDKGSNDGVEQDMPVITAGGIVGKILRAYPSTAQVLLINDQSSGVGALLEKSRLQGVLRGSPNGELILERVMSDEQISPGETVLSSGGDQIFPKGLPVGTISRVSPGKELFLNIKVKPAADLSRLEEVLVVTEKHEQEPLVEGGVRVRAADILAQRLPSVPDKPAGGAGSTTAAPSASSAARHVTGTTLKPPTDGAIKPSTESATTPAASAPLITGSVTTTNAAHKVSVAEQPVKIDILKKAVQKTASGNAVTDRSAVSPSNPNSGESFAKPATSKPKIPNTQSPSQPTTTEENPH